MENSTILRVILGDQGRVLSQISGPLHIVELNTPEKSNWVDVTQPPSSNEDYWDGTKFVNVGESPSSHHVFNYFTKTWIDPRTLDEIKAQRWTEIKSERDRLEFGGFEFDGGIYDSDQVSQTRIMGAAAAGMDQVWTLADNTTTYLAANELVQLYQALQMHIATTHQRGRAAREAIMSATTKDDVDAVTL